VEIENDGRYCISIYYNITLYLYRGYSDDADCARTANVNSRRVQIDETTAENQKLYRVQPHCAPTRRHPNKRPHNPIRCKAVR